MQRNRALHRPWVAPPATPAAFDAFLRRMQEPANACFLVIERESDGLAGVIDITQIVRGVFRSGYLGYYAFSGFEGRGLMREGLRLVVRCAFGGLKLHRLEANIQPGNAASIALVRQMYSPDRRLLPRGRPAGADVRARTA